MDIITNDGTKISLPSSSSIISAPLYSTLQYLKKEVLFALKPYNFGSYQTYYFGIDSGYFLFDLEVYVTEYNSVVEEQYAVKYTKYLEKGSDKSVFLRKISSTSYVIEFGSGSRGKWISGANIRLIIKSTRGAAGNLIDKTNLKLQISGDLLAFDYNYNIANQLTSTVQTVLQQPLVDFEYSENGVDSLSGEDLRDVIIKYIQTRDNLISQQDFYNIAEKYLTDFKFLFKKFNIFDNIFYLYRSFRDRNQTIFYTTSHTEPVMNLKYTTRLGYNITAVASTTGEGTLATDVYGYSIVAIDKWGQSLPSAIATAHVNNTIGENSVTITWEHVPYAISYRIYGRAFVSQDRYWEILITDPPFTTYSYIDTGTNGILEMKPMVYKLQDMYYNPQFTLDNKSFISPYVYKGNTRMNYYEGYLVKDLTRIEFSDIITETSALGTGFDAPVIYLNLEYDNIARETIIKVKSYQNITNLVFTISIIGDNLTISNKRMTCFPYLNNYFEYKYSNNKTFGLFEDQIQIQVQGGLSNSILTNNSGDYIINAENKILKIKFNDSSVGYINAFTTVILTEGTITAAQLATNINAAIGSPIASVYIDDNGDSKINIMPPSGDIVYNIFIGATGSTCLDVLGLIGNDTNPAILNGPLVTRRFIYKTDKFYQMIDVSDQIKLIRYNDGINSYLVNIPVMSYALFETDSEYYLDKIKNFITYASFNENRMVTDNVQCRFLNSYILKSPFIESIFLQSGKIFSNFEYIFLSPVIDTRNSPPPISINGSRYRIGSSPSEAFVGHENKIAIYNNEWSFYSPLINDFVLDLYDNIYYRWDGNDWTHIPDIRLPLKMRIEVKADIGYVQRNKIDIVSERETLEMLVAEYLQKGFSGSSITFYNSLITEFVHTGRPFIKSVQVFVTDSSIIPNELNNGIEVKAENDILTSFVNKLDIVKYTPPMIYWDIDNISIVTNVE